jgi:hypothetical protein
VKRAVILAFLLCLSAFAISESQGGLNISQPSPMNISQVGGSTVSTATTGVLKVGITGNAGAVVDAATNGAAPANQIWNVPSPTTATGAAVTMKFINASGAAVSVKAAAGNLYGFCLTNETTAVEYAEFFNTASAPTLGTTAVVLAIKLPISASVCPNLSALPLTAFSTGIGFASVTTENGSTTASITGGLFYQ